MSETMIIILAVVVLLAILAVPGYFLFKWALKKGGEKDELHKQLADEIGLNHTVSKRGLIKFNASTGAIQGKQVTIYEDTIRVGRGSATLITYLTISPNPFNFEFTISKKNLLNEIGKKSGLITDISTGNEAFDKVFLQQTNDEAKYKELMTNENQEKLLSIQSSLKAGIKSTPESLNYEINGSFKTENVKSDFKAVFDYIQSLN